MGGRDRAAGLLGVAVAGVGNAGAEHVRAFARSDRAKVAAIVDLATDRAKALAEDLQLDCPVTDDLAAALADPTVEAVVVATPSHLHRDHAIASARAGRHVLLEKPAAHSSEDLRSIAEEVDRAGVSCVVNMILRWHPMIEAVVARRDAGDLGEPFAVEADFIFGELEGSEPDWARKPEMGGSVHLYAGCHAYDQLQWLMGDSIAEVSAVSTSRSPRWGFDVTSHSVFRFRRGGIGRATVTLEARAPYRFGVRLFGTKGTAVDNTVCIPATGATQAVFEEICAERVDVTYLPFERVADHFVDVVTTGRESHASLRATIQLFEVAIAVDRSAKEGRPVRVG